MSSEKTKIDNIAAVLGEAAAHHATTGPAELGSTPKLAELAENEAQLNGDDAEESKPTEPQWYIDPKHLIGDLNIS